MARRWIQVDNRYLLKSEDRIYSSWLMVVFMLIAAYLFATRIFRPIDTWRRMLAAGLALVFAGTAFWFARWLLRPAPEVEHTATIACSRGDEAPFFLASCTCGWDSGVCDSEAEARADALRHTPNIEPEIEYPLGR